MPTYRYRCQDCGEEFDVWQSIKDDTLRTHDLGCGGQLSRVFSPAGIVLKGSGFYRNDSRSGAPKEKEHANGDSSKEPSKEAAAAKDGKAGDGKSGDAKSGDAKSGDRKSGDSKSSRETKSGDKSGSPSTAGTKSS